MFPIDREITFHQITNLFLFICIAPLIRQVPSALVETSGNIAYFSALFSILPIIPLVAIVILLLQTYPGKNLYEILENILGKYLAIVVLFLYMIWALMTVVVIMNQYVFTMQSTLMPYTKSNYFIIAMLILVFYAVHKGMKTIFRISELILVPSLLFLAILIVFGVSKFNMDYLFPMTTTNILPTMVASKYVYTVAGNIIIILFFIDKVKNYMEHKKQNIKNLWCSVLVFVLTGTILTTVTLAINGPNLSSKLPFAFFMTAKRIAVFKVFERLEAFVTLLCVLSDFIAISIFIVIVIRCLKWIFALDHIPYLEIPLAMLIYYLTFYLSNTQFELINFYNTVYLPTNIIFQYMGPLFIIIIFYSKQLYKKPNMERGKS